MSESSNPPSSPSSPPISTSEVLTPEASTPGRIGYEAYGNHPGTHGPWTTFDGRPMPTWLDLLKGGAAGLLTRDRWESAAQAIAEFERRSGADAAPTRKRIPAGTITVNVPELKVDASDLESQADRLEGLVNQLSTAPVSMSDLCDGARALAEATALLRDIDSDASKAVAALVQDMAKCLSAQVRELTPQSQP